MWAIEIENPGKDSFLRIGECTLPQILPHEVLIQTKAAGVNRADIFQRQGLYPPPAGASDILGLEVAGVITQVGKEVLGLKQGDKVCALLEGGGYAEYVSVAHTQALLLPKGIDFVQGAALPEALFTLYSNMFFLAGLARGESMLMHGGASGLGTFAVQIARVFGIDCYVTVGSDKKREALRKLGAKLTINYKTTDFVEEIKSFTEGKGVDCVFDIVGGDYFSRNLKILANGGRMVCLSFLSGAKIDANLAPLVFKNLKIMGSSLRSKPLEDKAKIATLLQKEIWPLLENSKIVPVIDSVFSFSEVNSAHKLMEDSLHIGKIILKCD